jgi:hypothetical protein
VVAANKDWMFSEPSSAKKPSSKTAPSPFTAEEDRRLNEAVIL